MSENKFLSGAEPDTKGEGRRGIFGSLLIFTALIVLLNPNFTTIDILPDCIAYFIIAAMAKKYASLVPYFAEVREGCLKLGLITLMKIPAMAVMFASMSAGRDIVPLLTLVFVTLELIVLYPTLANGFSALFYIGERSNMTEFISAFKVFGIRVHTDFLRAVAFVFVSVKGALNVLPEFCLLTFDTDTTVAMLRRLYPILEVISILTVFLIGVFLFVLAYGYIGAIRKGRGLADAVYSIVDADRLASYEYTRRIKTKFSKLTLLAISAIFTFDVCFGGTNYDMTEALNDGLTILPRFVYAIIIMVCTTGLFSKKRYTIPIYVSGAAYSVFSILNTIFTKLFLKDYTYSSLLEEAASSFAQSPAKAAYLPVEIFAVLEAAAMAVLALTLGLGLVDFLRENTGADTELEVLRGQDKEFRRNMNIKGIVFGLFPLVISVSKALNTFFIGAPSLIFTDPSDVTMPTIITSAVPWFGTLIFALCVAYAFYAFYFMGEIKAEMKMKFSDSEHPFE